MSPPPETASAAEQRFRALYADVHADVLRFVRRRLPLEQVSSAEDVVADALLVTWRRFDDAPRRLDAQRAWVFGIARNCLLTSHRGRGRREALAVRVADGTSGASPGLDPVTTPHDGLVAGLDLAAAWRRLRPAEQEVLALAVFEDLTSAQAAVVLGTTPTGYRLRLMRARRALRAHLDADDAEEPAPALRSAAPRTASHPAPAHPVPRAATDALEAIR